MLENHSAEQWNLLANRLLLAYVRRRLGEDDPHAWGRFCREPYARPHAHASSQQAGATRIAVGYKNAFAEDMAERDTYPTQADVREYWNECMRRAEADILVYLAAS